MKFGWRDSAASANVPDVSDVEAEVDQEFEDACLALAMSDVPKDSRPPAPGGPATVVGLAGTVDWFKVQEQEAAPVTRSFGAPTAAEFAEADPAESASGESESPAEITARDLVRPIPDVSVPAAAAAVVVEPEPTIPVAPPAPVAPAQFEAARFESAPLDPRQGRDGAALAITQAELAAAKTELESLRADFQAERFRSRDERLRLEDELASARQIVHSAATDAADADEVAALHREVDILRGELVALRSRHAEETDRLEQDVKAAQAREAQTVIAAQLAEDEMKAIRTERDAARATAQEVGAVRAESDELRRRIQELEYQVRTLGAALDETEKDLRISRDTATERIRRAENLLAAREAELQVTQQELLEAEERRAEEAASFLAALQKPV